MSRNTQDQKEPPAGSNLPAVRGPLEYLMDLVGDSRIYFSLSGKEILEFFRSFPNAAKSLLGGNASLKNPLEQTLAQESLPPAEVPPPKTRIKVEPTSKPSPPKKTAVKTSPVPRTPWKTYQPDWPLTEEGDPKKRITEEEAIQIVLGYRTYLRSYDLTEQVATEQARHFLRFKNSSSAGRILNIMEQRGLVRLVGKWRNTRRKSGHTKRAPYYLYAFVDPLKVTPEKALQEAVKAVRSDTSPPTPTNLVRELATAVGSDRSVSQGIGCSMETLGKWMKRNLIPRRHDLLSNLGDLIKLHTPKNFPEFNRRRREIEDSQVAGEKTPKVLQVTPPKDSHLFDRLKAKCGLTHVQMGDKAGEMGKKLGVESKFDGTCFSQWRSRGTYPRKHHAIRGLLLLIQCYLPEELNYWEKKLKMKVPSKGQK